MDYAAAHQVFFAPAPDGTPQPAVVREGSPARRLRDAAEPLGIHAAWSRTVNERLAAYGLDFLSSYVWGRAATLGEPAPAVVAAAFAAFEPGLVASLYDAGRRALGRDEFLRVQEEAVAASLRDILDDESEADVRRADAILRRAVDAVDGTGRPLFSGVRVLDAPADPLAALWRACQAVREYRGDSHVAAYIGAGLDPVEMNILTELWVGWGLGSYVATRGWSAERIDRALATLRSAGLVDGDALSEEGQRARWEIEEHTDRMVQPLVEAIGDDLAWVLDRLNGWGAMLIKADAFPPNPLKRAAG